MKAINKNYIFQQPINYASNDNKLSLAKCKKILNVDGFCYTDEEVIKIRDWLYHMVDIAIDALDKNAKKIKTSN